MSKKQKFMNGQGTDHENDTHMSSILIPLSRAINTAKLCLEDVGGFLPASLWAVEIHSQPQPARHSFDRALPAMSSENTQTAVRCTGCGLYIPSSMSTHVLCIADAILQSCLE